MSPRYCSRLDSVVPQRCTCVSSESNLVYLSVSDKHLEAIRQIQAGWVQVITNGKRSLCRRLGRYEGEDDFIHRLLYVFKQLSHMYFFTYYSTDALLAIPTTIPSVCPWLEYSQCTATVVNTLEQTLVQRDSMPKNKMCLHILGFKQGTDGLEAI